MVSEVEVVEVVDGDEVEVVDDVDVVPGGSFGPVTRGVPMNSKCIPSAIGNVPPHANPCRRKTSTTRSSMEGVVPYRLVDGLMSIAAPHECRERFRPLVPLCDLISRELNDPP